MLTVEDYRRFYAEEIRFVANLSSEALVEAFACVPREKFLGAGPWQVGAPELRALAAAGLGEAAYVTVDDPRQLYHNVVVVIDAARDINNGQPSALARWISALELKAGDRVFHLGCGTGYYTAVMAEVVGAEGSVVASEFDPALAARARENLSAYEQVEVHAGDGAALDPGVCDAMLINAGVTYPHALWLERLREGGSLVLPFTIATSQTIGAGLMTRIVREAGGYSARGVTPVGIYSCTSLRDAEMEGLLRKALTTQTLLAVKSLRLDSHEEAETCIVHGQSFCLSGAEL